MTARSKNMAELYGYRTDKHIVFYRSVSECVVEVVRIQHECMELKNRIGE